jgi:hypothetical protein
MEATVDRSSTKLSIEDMRWKLMAVKEPSDWQDEVANMTPSQVVHKFNYFHSIGRIHKEKNR